jgi:tetratricopeptide (TPR) repeat protein
MLAFMKSVVFSLATVRASMTVPSLAASLAFASFLPTGAYAQTQTPPRATPAPTMPSAPTLTAPPVNERMMVMGVLAAEFALQEGDIDTAAATYAEMARRSKDGKVAERAVELLLRQRRIADAKEIVAIWQTADPTAPRANQIALALAINSEDSAGAFKAVSRAVSLPADVRGASIVDMARQFAQLKDRDFAVRLASIFIETMPELAESHYALSVASTGTENARINESLLAIDKALAIKPGWPQAVAVKARLLAFRSEARKAKRAATGNNAGAVAAASVPDEAVKLLQETLASNADSHELKLMLARAQFDAEQFAEARRLFLELANDEKEDLEDMQLAATLASFSANDWDTAEKEFSEALSAERGEPNALRYYLGRVSEGRKRWAEAAERFAQVQRTGAGDRYWESQLRVATSLAADKRVPQAVAHLRGMKAINSRERSLAVQTEASLWREAGDNEKALAALDEAITADDKNTDLIYESAMTLERMGRVADAETRLRRVIALQPERADAMNALGYGLADRNVNLDEARELIEKAHKIAPEDAAILDSMGWIAFRQGKLKEAEEFLRRAYVKFEDAEIAAHLGEVLWVQGNKDDARAMWKKQLSKQPNSDILKKTMKRLDPQF